MPDEQASRRDYLSLQAMEPSDGSLTGKVLISFDRMQSVGRRSMAHAKECAFIVPAVLQAPTAVFQGIRIDEDEDRTGFGWRCYCGLPEHSYSPDGTARRPYPNQVYLVFVNDEGVAYNWRWERADADDRRLPVDHATRFHERLL